MEIGTDLLRSFVAVAESLNFTRAAEAVHKTQSAVSQQIKKLEGDLGIQLFDRSGRVVRLTSVGDSFLPHARRILKAHDEAIAAVRTPELTGLVRVGTSDELAMRFFPTILKRFAEYYPAMQVEVRTDNGTELKRMVTEGELDFFVNTSTYTFPGTEIIAHTPLLWVSSAGHLVHQESPVPLAVYSQGCSYREHATEALNAAGLAYRIAYTSPSLASLHAAITVGAAVAALTPISLPPNARILGMQEGYPPLPMTNIYMAKADTMNRGANCFIKLACEIIRQEESLLATLPAPESCCSAA
ncbi:LysR substrate-binding domain-containing protein [Desulfovibrio subterraneus]|uniref:LysR substrate-binding domain-containing protein n=1 Tax=Desulfovibrio subterraneus TaxID=2718620 RepID=UPI0022B8E395|nr:LysR substrate-binding domain-containing protein [Desulfovibrio subterraneus]WBF67046.1 LysR substrate-binding domain-containing protein [Desulfovibrio subterraneus]